MLEVSKQVMDLDARIWEKSSVMGTRHKAGAWPQKQSMRLASGTIGGLATGCNWQE